MFRLTALFTNVLSIGPIDAPAWLPASAAAMVAGYVSTKILLRSKPSAAARAGNLLVNSFLIYLCVWKISPTIFSLRMVIQQPLLILYAPGGLAGALTGFFTVFVYLGFSYFKNRPISPGFVRSTGIAVVVSLCVFFAITFAISSQANPRQKAGSAAAPGFVLDTMDGVAIRLADYRGSYIVLNFWATWCLPCRAEIPELTALHNDIVSGKGESPIVLLSINQTASEDGLASVIKFIEKHSIEFAVLLDRKNKVANLYGIRGIPTTFILDREGNILARRTGVISGSWISGVIKKDHSGVINSELPSPAKTEYRAAELQLR